ncbi:hypothetical protein [Erythrobacter ani]|uniref:Haem-binding uptake Tiki superfamily ChaN domain-containing protein n=1 Tax=Erythrobacter ani TaxID=2827235 RepID=A0ABS6SR24_9SPHN|nr:hypothetical protein [Erythrobacter ani]MBV7267477.1 hypothetical protein [Erythrobacter ani]
MKTTRRSAMLGSLAAATGASAASQTLASCSFDEAATDTLTSVSVIGAIHGTHRDSRQYSLEVLRKAVERFEPDIVLSEIPPDRIEEARKSFAETGEVTEERTRVFPELTDVVFPLSREMDFTIAGTAGWTRELAANRSAALTRIENDPARASQWTEHQAAREQYSQSINGSGQDPKFIHTPEYDVLVQRAQTPYQVYFDPDLGPGGWTRINRAHTDLIEDALDRISGQGLKALVIFGAWHKYMIERALMLRSDIELTSARSLFG